MSGYVIQRKTAQIALCHLSRVFFALPAPRRSKPRATLQPSIRLRDSVQSALRSVDTSSYNLGRSEQVLLGLVHLSAPQGAKRPFL